jgi:hypothetical protein
VAVVVRKGFSRHTTEDGVAAEDHHCCHQKVLPYEVVVFVDAALLKGTKRERAK